jgi:hypothetical protein
MSNTISIPAASGVGRIRIRDRRRTRRAPAGAIVVPVAEPSRQDYRAPRRALLAHDDVRQFIMSFAAFFTAAMIFLA